MRPEQQVCVVCGEADTIHRFTSKDFQYKVSGQFNVRGCRRCGLDRLDPMPSAGEIEGFYACQDLYPYKTIRYTVIAWVKIKVARLLYHALFKQKGRLIGGVASLVRWLLKKRVVPIDPEGRTFFEVGAGNGAYLYTMQQLGWNVAGCELSRTGVEAAKGLGLAVDHGTLESGNYPAGSFDVLRLDQVFEHLRDPRGFLREAYRVIKPDGFLVVGVPNADAISYTLFGPYWGILGVPFHLFQYSPRALEALLDEAGFEVQWFRYNSMPICWVWSVNNWFNERLSSSTDVGFITNYPVRLLMTLLLRPFLSLMTMLSPERAEIVMVYARRRPHLDATGDSYHRCSNVEENANLHLASD